MEIVKDSSVLQVILQRRSIRKYAKDEIPEDHITHLIEVLRWAPSAGNCQPWHFYLVKNQQMKYALAQAAFGQDFIAQAPVVFVICAIPKRSAARYGKRGETLYVYQDTAAAVQNLLLTATGYGYGSCWVGAFDEFRVSKVLQLPIQQRPVAVVPIGKPAEQVHPPARLRKENTFTLLD